MAEERETENFIRQCGFSLYSAYDNIDMLTHLVEPRGASIALNAILLHVAFL